MTQAEDEAHRVKLRERLWALIKIAQEKGATEAAEWIPAVMSVTIDKPQESKRYPGGEHHSSWGWHR